MNKSFRNYLIYLIFFIVVIKFFNTPYNAYSLLKFDYSTRMIQTYGDCERESWGFYDKVIKKLNFKNEEIRIINSEGYVVIDPIFKEIKQTKKKNSKFLMLLNFKSEGSKNFYDTEIENIDKYFLKYSFGNCYLLERND